MIRKILAFLLRFTFLMLVPLLLFAYAIKATFFNQDFIYSKFIPKSYEPVISLLASQSAAKTPDKEPIFLERIRAMLPKSTYEKMLKTVADPFIAQVKVWVASGNIVFPVVIDIQEAKSNLKDDIVEIVKNTPACPANEKNSEDFTFCKPAAAQGMELEIKSMVDKEMPHRLTIGDESLNAYAPMVSRAIFAIKYFDYIVFTIPLILLFLIGILVFEPWSLVLKKLGGTLLSTGISILIVVVTIPELINSVLATQQAILPAQKDFIVFVFSQPLSILNYLTVTILACGIVMFVAGKIIEHENKPKKK